MANRADTLYKITGSRKAVNDLWTTLQNMEVNSKNIWLDELAKFYGIDYEKKHISVRGNIYFAEMDADDMNDHYVLQSKRIQHGPAVTTFSVKSVLFYGMSW